MKELTYGEWQKKPTPREMWVWDDGEEDKRKRKVIYISKETSPVVSITLDDKHVEHYKHCAEIKKSRRMTNKELSRWLHEKPTREYKFKGGEYVYKDYIYKLNCQDEEIKQNIVIREDYCEWKEPLTQIEYE